jgi:hypothetical protein
LTLRTGLFVAIIGLAILLANVAGRGKDAISSWNYSLDPNGMGAQLLISLNYGGHEIRLNAPRAFKGVLYILDYEGIEKLVANGTITPVVNETFQGSTLIDFTLDRRGPYAVVVQSNMPNEAQVSASLLEKGTLRQDYLWDSGIIIAVGVAIAFFALIPRMGRFMKPKLSKARSRATSFLSIEFCAY